jgi:hypothetical protein
MKIKVPKALQAYISDNFLEVPPSVGSTYSEEERVIIAVTNNSEPVLSGKLYSCVAISMAGFRPFAIESLAPLPLLSALVADVNREALDRVLALLLTNTLFRVAVIKSRVFKGLFGDDRLINASITGAGVATVMTAALTLPRHCSWIDISLLTIDGESAVDAQKCMRIDGVSFFQIDEITRVRL